MIFSYLLSLVVISVHLCSIKKEQAMLNSISKIMIIPSLFLSFFLTSSALGLTLSGVEPLLCALLFYTLGDLLMELKGKFKFGALSFALGHVSYIVYFLMHGFSLPDGVLWALLWFSSFFFYFSSYVPIKRDGMLITYAVLLLLFGSAVGASGESGFQMHKIYAFFGVVAYTFSDSLLIIQKKRGDHNDELMVMMTYYVANLMLLLGVLFLNLGI